MTEHQRQYIEENLGKKLQKEIAEDIGVSKWELSMYLNKKGKYEFSGREHLFNVDEIGFEKTWLI